MDKTEENKNEITNTKDITEEDSKKNKIEEENNKNNNNNKNEEEIKNNKVEIQETVEQEKKWLLENSEMFMKRYDSNKKFMDRLKYNLKREKLNPSLYRVI